MLPGGTLGLVVAPGRLIFLSGDLLLGLLASVNLSSSWLNSVSGSGYILRVHKFKSSL